MNISFHGAAREVTGSCHLVEVDGDRFLLDCGMIQGGAERHERNREPFPFQPSDLRGVVLSHAHIDHSGRLPLLVKRGFRGPIVCTDATADLCRILLTDSARIHEEDARWKVKRLKRRGEDSSWVRPLYTEEDARAVIEQLVPVEFGERHELGSNAAVEFTKAGHILGAGIVQLSLGQAQRQLTFSGDLGVEGARLLSSPKPVACPDYLLIESTYGDRNRDEPGDRTEQLRRVIRATIDRGGKLIIPSFAVGRTQELLSRINDLVESGRIPKVPIFVDSPMAVEASRVFARHPDAYSEDARQKLHAGDRPLEFPGLEWVVKAQDSIAINKSKEPSVIISASGMCTAGRVKHHLKHNISNPRSTVLFVGYQARGSLGRIIQSGVSPVRIFGDWYPVEARIETISGFSAHADREGLLAWFEALGGRPRHTFVVHGEEPVAMNFAATLRDKFGVQAEAPELGQSFGLE